MTHSHNHHDHHHSSSGDIKVAFFLNLGFAVIEIFGGLWTNSLAILSDALHDLGDSLSLGLAWYLDRYATRDRDKRFSYGYRRFSLLGALLNTVILIAGSLFILSEAIPRLLHPEPINAGGMVLLAVGGILVNGLAVLRMRGGKTLNAQVVTWHLLEDVLGWVAVLVVSIVLLFRDLPILDPILSALITLYVLYNVVRKLRQTLALFLQGVPDGIDVDAVEGRLLALAGVQSAHDTHIWSLDGEQNVLTTHLVVDDCASRDDMAKIKQGIRLVTRDLSVSHITVEFESGDEDCSMMG